VDHEDKERDSGGGPAETDDGTVDAGGDASEAQDESRRSILQREPVRVVAGPTGSGKTTTMARLVAQHGSTCWLADRHESLDEAVATIEAAGGRVGRVLSLDGKMADGTPHCLHPGKIHQWQEKGYDYRAGFCNLARCCDREGNPSECSFLQSLDELEDADTIAVTKALASRPGFFQSKGNTHRENIVVDEDPIGMLRPLVQITRDEAEKMVALAEELITEFLEKDDDHPAVKQARVLHQTAKWCWREMAR